MNVKTEKHPRIRVAGIVTKRDKILLVKHVRNNQAYYLLPGGGLEWGETCQEGLAREFEEELSLGVRVGDLICVNESIEPHGKRHILNLSFRARIISGTLQVNQDRRLKGACWVDRNELMELTFYPEIRKTVLKAWDKKFKEGAVLIHTPWE